MAERCRAVLQVDRTRAERSAHFWSACDVRAFFARELRFLAQLLIKRVLLVVLHLLRVVNVDVVVVVVRNVVDVDVYVAGLQVLALISVVADDRPSQIGFLLGFLFDHWKLVSQVSGVFLEQRVFEVQVHDRLGARVLGRRPDLRRVVG